MACARHCGETGKCVDRLAKPFSQIQGNENLCEAAKSVDDKLLLFEEYGIQVGSLRYFANKRRRISPAAFSCSIRGRTN